MILKSRLGSGSIPKYLYPSRPFLLQKWNEEAQLAISTANLLDIHAVYTFWMR
jgi:hypothetical protein